MRSREYGDQRGRYTNPTRNGCSAHVLVEVITNRHEWPLGLTRYRCLKGVFEDALETSNPVAIYRRDLRNGEHAKRYLQLLPLDKPELERSI